MSLSENINKLSSLLNKKNKDLISIKGLECFSNNFNKKSMIHIFGDYYSGKTSFGLDLIKKNKDLVFIYIDTYSSIVTLPENSAILRTNRLDIILSTLEKLEPNTCDCIILDAYSNIYCKNDIWENETYKIMQDALSKIISLCMKKNCTLILINTLNGLGKAFNRNNYLKINSLLELQITNYDYENGVMDILPLKAKCKNIIKYKLEKE